MDVREAPVDGHRDRRGQEVDREDPGVEGKAAEVTDPPQALDLWNRIDRRIVDDAPVVPTVNRAFTTFVSRRVGNVQTTPLASVLLDQMWVK